MKLFLVRHAESSDNEKRIVSSDNSSLNQKGIVEAKRLIKKMPKDAEITEIWTSPIERANQTANIIAFSYPNIRIIQKKEVAEKREASSLIGKNRKEMPWDVIIKQRINTEWKYEDGESFNDVKKRLKLVLNELKEYPNDANILIVTHNSFIKHLVTYILLGNKFSPKTFYPLSDRLETKTGGITILEKKQKYYEKKSSWYLSTWMS